MIFSISFRISCLASGLALALVALRPEALATVPFAQFVDPHPAPGNQFGDSIVALSSGNVVITAPYSDFNGLNTGSVYLFNGATGALISELHGSTYDDRIGSDGVTALSNGNFIVRSQHWDNGSIVNAGAVTWGSGITGVSGVVSQSNSLVGGTVGDRVGTEGVIGLANGNYVVESPSWDKSGE